MGAMGRLRFALLRVLLLGLTMISLGLEWWGGGLLKHPHIPPFCTPICPQNMGATQNPPHPSAHPGKSKAVSLPNPEVPVELMEPDFHPYLSTRLLGLPPAPQSPLNLPYNCSLLCKQLLGGLAWGLHEKRVIWGWPAVLRLSRE